MIQLTKSDNALDRYEDVQGNILRGFNKPQVRLLFFQFGEGGPHAERNRSWIRSLAVWIPNTRKLVESAAQLKSNLKFDPMLKPQDAWLHISLSATGIRKLALPFVYSRGIYAGHGKKAKINMLDPENRDAIRRTGSGDPFIEGMKARAVNMLGDVSTNSPQDWDEPYKSKDIDALFIVAGDQAHDVDSFATQLVAEGTNIGSVCVGMEIGNALFNEQGKQVEHFGFRDGISQPLIKGIDTHDRRIYVDELDPEDFILFGLQDDKVTGDKLSWANHGSFLVFRKLEQHVPEFWEELTLACKDRKIELCDQKHYDDEKYLAPEHLAAMFVGRWKSGAPLAEYPHFDPVSPEMSNHNDFMYRHESNIDPHPFDPKGKVTPVFAHIRIANSRDDDIRGGIGSPAENRSENDLHRILRRGIPYGPQWAKDLETKTVHRRGMLFLCFQRDIEQQFEYVQNRWWNTDHKYKELEHKCIIDLLDEASVKKFHMGLERWVDTKGGGYFFSPSITALQNLEQYVVYP